MPRTIEKVEKMTLPVVAMRGIVAFPSIPVSFEVVREFGIAASEAANNSDMYVFLVTQKDLSSEEPEIDVLYEVGTVAKIKQTLKTPEGHIRLIADGMCRASVVKYEKGEKYITAEVMCKTISLDESPDIKTEAMMREAISCLEKMLAYIPTVSDELIYTARSIKNPGLLADFIASNVLVKYHDKQKILELFDPIVRIETISVVIESERKLLEIESDLHRKVRRKLDANQRDYYMREQLKVIQNELGMEGQNELDEYIDKIYAAELNEEIEEKLLKEVGKLGKISPGSPEGTVIRNYLDVCLEIPWNKKSKDRADIQTARKILNADHDGLEKIKERILEFIAVKQLNPNIANQIICFVGPPGVGKTSLAASIARSLKREYVRVSLGGIRDEADIRGHRKTYIGSMPGRIIEALTRAGTRNPLILLDEIDKMGIGGVHGDPASALLEVLDGEQNKAFRDHFIELPVDLSDCMFIATANTLETVARPLIDRMEIIELHTYTRHEKLAIAKNHLIPKQLKKHGLNKRLIKISDEVILELIDGFTRESGVRNLERQIGTLCRKAAVKIVDEGLKSVAIKKEELQKYLGHRRIDADDVSEADEIGVVNGLAYTEVGGDILKIEVAVMDGSGKIELTGSLGDIMKESARIGVSYIRAHADELEIDKDFSTAKDIHIHVPEGAVPKDGPSAGVTMLTALVSALSKRPVKRDVAMTGEVTLTGNVLPIGGLREKTTAAYTAGVKTVLVPSKNSSDLDEIDQVVRNGMEFIPCSKVSDVLKNALIWDKKPISDDISHDYIKKSKADAEISDGVILPISEIQPSYDVPSV
ncbi:atp dependent lon protease family member [Holotrichia oblita]|nr:atp dependent lon protease family member [Holotrichia oblita]